MEQAGQGPRWTFGSGTQLGYAAALIVVSTVALGALAFGILWPFLLKRQPFYSGSPAEILATLITLGCAVVIVYVSLIRFARTSLRDLGWRGDHLLRDLGAGLLGFMVTETLFISVFFGSLERFLDAAARFSFGQRVEAVLSGILAAFFEETVFRGYLQQGLERRIPRWAAVAVTALIFSAKHGRFDAMSFGLFFCYGAVWGTLRTLTNRLNAGAFAHLLNWAVNAFL